VVASLTRKKSAKCAGFIHCVGRVIDRANIIAQDQGSGGASSAHKSFVRSLPRARAEQLWLKRVDLQRALLEPHPHQAQTPRSLRSRGSWPCSGALRTPWGDADAPGVYVITSISADRAAPAAAFLLVTAMAVRSAGTRVL
jgi:hypothetical protein